MAREQTISAYDGRAILTMDRWHRYFVTAPELGIHREYQPGVTSIIGMKDKSGPLTYWAVDCALEYIKEGLDELEAHLAINTDSQHLVLDTVSTEWLLERMKQARHNFRNVRREAADVGKLAHNYLHRHMEWLHFGGDAPKRPTLEMFPKMTKEQIEQANAGIDAGLSFFTEHHLVPVTMEKPVWSPAHGYIGTDDFIGRVDDELCVLDYKTSKDIYPEVFMQLAAYSEAYMEEFRQHYIEAGWAINIVKEDVRGKDDGEIIRHAGDFQAIRRPAEMMLGDFEGFLGLHRAYCWDRVNGDDPKSPIVIPGKFPKLTKAKQKKLAAARS